MSTDMTITNPAVEVQPSGQATTFRVHCPLYGCTATTVHEAEMDAHVLKCHDAVVVVAPATCVHCGRTAPDVVDQGWGPSEPMCDDADACEAEADRARQLDSGTL